MFGFWRVPVAPATAGSRADTRSSWDAVLSDFGAGACETAGDLPAILLGSLRLDRVCFEAEPGPFSPRKGLFTARFLGRAELLTRGAEDGAG